MDEKPRRRWFQFSLGTLFVLVVICAFVAFVGPPIASWLFPPDHDFGGESAVNDPDFKELMRKVEQSLQQPQGVDDKTGIVITHGAGLSVPREN